MQRVTRESGGGTDFRLTFHAHARTPSSASAKVVRLEICMISALRKRAAPDVGLAALSLRAKKRDAISSASLFRRILYVVTR